MQGGAIGAVLHRAAESQPRRTRSPTTSTPGTGPRRRSPRRGAIARCTSPATRAATYMRGAAAERARAEHRTRPIVHYTPNETISGVEFQLRTGNRQRAAGGRHVLEHPVAAHRCVRSSASSMPARRRTSVRPGLTLVIVREDLLGQARVRDPVGVQLQGGGRRGLAAEHAADVRLVRGRAGVQMAEEKRRRCRDGRAQPRQGAARCTRRSTAPRSTEPVAQDARSWMNVTFTLRKPELDAAFLEQAAAAGLHNLKGHRLSGGMRASLYNAMPIDGCRGADRLHARIRAQARMKTHGKVRERMVELQAQVAPRPARRARRGRGTAHCPAGAADLGEHPRAHRRDRCADSRAAQRARTLRATGRHLEVGEPARRSISTARSARRRSCARRSSAIDGPLRDEEIARLFREIMSACLAQQEPLKVAFLGPEGTFTQAAVLKHFGSSVRALPLPAIDEVFHEVEGGIADFGVVPIENSSEGTVNHTLDMFLASALKICGEVELRIHHHLMGRMSALADVQARVRARPGARRSAAAGWTSSCPTSSVSPCRAMPRARGARATSAARRRSRAGPRPRSTGSTLLADEIEDRPDNTTRFLVVGRKLFSPSGADRTTLLVSASDTDDAGALFRLLEPFAEHRINMTRIESRPSRKRKWDYVFFIDVEGHVSDPPLAKALASLEKRASLVQDAGLLSAGRALMAHVPTRPSRQRIDARRPRARRRDGHGAGRQVHLAPRAPAVGASPTATSEMQRLSGERGLPGDPRGDARAGRAPSSSRRRRRCGCTASGCAGLQGRAARARHGQCRHGDAAVHGTARGAVLRLRADRRCLADAAAHGARGAAAARDGRRRAHPRRHAAGRASAAGAALHGIDYRMPVASAQVKSAHPAGGAVCRRAHAPSPRRRACRDHSERMLASCGRARSRREGLDDHARSARSGWRASSSRCRAISPRRHSSSSPASRRGAARAAARRTSGSIRRAPDCSTSCAAWAADIEIENPRVERRPSRWRTCACSARRLRGIAVPAAAGAAGDR